MGWFNSNLFIHAANVILLVGFSVRDILWLRLLAMASSLIVMLFFLQQPVPLWEPIIWSSVFAAINLFQAWRIIRERQPVKLTPEEEEVRKLAFPDLPPRKVLRVLALGYWTDEKKGARLIECGKTLDAVSLILHGRVRISKNDRVLGELVPGDLVCSAVLMSGAPADVDAVVVEPVHGVHWELGPLEHYLDADPETRLALQRHISRDLAGRLTRSTAALL